MPSEALRIFIAAEGSFAWCC